MSILALAVVLCSHDDKTRLLRGNCNDMYVCDRWPEKTRQSQRAMMSHKCMYIQFVNTVFLNWLID